MAERAWNAALGTNGQQQVVADQILAGVDLWRDSQDWIEDHGKWIPRTARFISAGKWRGEPKGFAFVRDRTGCINCGGPADDFAYDRDGRPFCFCRKCQPRLSGQLQNQREAIPAMELVGKD